MWCLARFLPLIVGVKVPQTDEKWQLFLKMLDITDIIFSQVTSHNQAATLVVLALHPGYISTRRPRGAPFPRAMRGNVAQISAYGMHFVDPTRRPRGAPNK